LETHRASPTTLLLLTAAAAEPNHRANKTFQDDPIPPIAAADAKPVNHTPPEFPNPERPRRRLGPPSATQQNLSVSVLTSGVARG